MKATIATFILALGLVCAASIMLRGTLGVFFCTVVVSLCWAFLAVEFLRLHQVNRPRVSFGFSIALTGLVLVGIFNLPLHVAFRLYRAEFKARVLAGIQDNPPPQGSTGPFHVIGTGSHGRSQYFLTGGSGFEVHGFVYRGPGAPEGDYNLGTSTSLGHGWFYIEED